MYEKYKYNNEFNKERYAHLTILVPKGTKSAILARIRTKGYKSVSDYFKSLLCRNLGVSDLSELKEGGNTEN